MRHEAWATIKMQSGMLSNVRIRVWMNEGAKIDIQWRVHFCNVCSTSGVCAFNRHECHRHEYTSSGGALALQCNILTAAHMFSADKCIRNRHSHSQCDRRHTDQPNDNKWKSFRVCVCIDRAVFFNSTLVQFFKQTHLTTLVRPLRVPRNSPRIQDNR